LQYKILPRALNKNNDVSLPPIDANSDSFSPWLSVALDDFDFALDERLLECFLRVVFPLILPPDKRSPVSENYRTYLYSFIRDQLFLNIYVIT
jgi:hypothetical protein